MKKTTIIMFGFLAILNQYLGCTFVIDTPGEYLLGTDLVEFGTDVILISTSKVILDMNKKGVAGGINGIKVSDGVNSVIIRNGLIKSVFNAGISIGSNCSLIQIQTVVIDACLKRAIEFLGTSTAPSCKSLLQDVRVTSCGKDPSATSLIFLNSCCDIACEGVLMFGNGGPNNMLSLFSIQNSMEIVGRGIVGLDTMSGSGIGIDFVNSKNCTLGNCIIGDSSAEGVNGNFIGFCLREGSKKILVSQCSVLSCSAAGGTATGFDVGENCSENVFDRCSVSGLSGGNSIGFYVHGQGTPSNTKNNIFNFCNVVNNDAVNEGGIAAGFLISRADRGTIAHSTASYNFATTGTAMGIFFEESTGGNGWFVEENKTVHNLGVSDQYSFGIRFAAGSKNLFSKNMAFDNGSTMSNQLANISLGSQLQLTSGNLNSAKEPWSNISVIS